MRKTKKFISMLGMVVMLSVLITGLPFCKATKAAAVNQTITLNELTVVEADAGAVLFDFTPTESKMYYVYTYGLDDTYGVLRDYNGNAIASNDDAGRGYNFYLECYLRQGKTYTISVKEYDGYNFCSLLYVTDIGSSYVDIGNANETKYCSVGDNVTLSAKYSDSEVLVEYSPSFVDSMDLEVVWQKDYSDENIHEGVTYERVIDEDDIGATYTATIMYEDIVLSRYELTILDKADYIRTENKTISTSVGETITITPSIYNYDGQKLNINAYSMEWYLYGEYDYYDEDALLLGSDNTLTINAKNNYFYSKSYSYIRANIYKNEELVGVARYYLYDTENGEISFSSKELYGMAGANIDLNVDAKVNGTEIDLDSGYKYKWYVVEGDYYDYDESEVFLAETNQKEFTVAIPNDAFVDNSYIKYMVKMFEGSNYVGRQNFYVYNKERLGCEGKSYYINIGDSVDLVPRIYGYYNEKPVDINDSRLSYEWYKGYYYDDELETLNYTNSVYSIDSVTSEDLRSNEVYYKALVYKDGESIGSCYFYLYDAEFAYECGTRNYYIDSRSSLDLWPKVYSQMTDEILSEEELQESDFEFKWYKVSTPFDEEYEYYDDDDVTKTELSCTTASYHLETVSDSDLYNNYENDYRYYYEVEVYKNDTFLDSSKIHIYDNANVYYAERATYYAKLNDYITIEPLVYDYDDEKVDLSSDEFTFKWTKYEYDEGDYYSTRIELDNTTNTLYIPRLTEKDFYDYYGDDYYAERSYYYVEIYKHGKYVDGALIYIRYDENAELQSPRPVVTNSPTPTVKPTPTPTPTPTASATVSPTILPTVSPSSSPNNGGSTTVKKKKTVKFTKKSVKIKKGKKITLKVKIKNAKKAKFSVDKKGKKIVKLMKKKAKSVVVKGKKKGTAKITAKVAGAKKATCKVKVK